MDFKELGEYLGLEPEEFNELVELLMETAVVDIKKLQNSMENGDLIQAVEAAHSLKGSSGNLGFAELSAVASDAEKNCRTNSVEDPEKIVSELKERLDDIVKNYEATKTE